MPTPPFSLPPPHPLLSGFDFISMGLTHKCSSSSRLSFRKMAEEEEEVEEEVEEEGEKEEVKGR